MKLKLPKIIETQRLTLKKHSLDPSYVQLCMDSINQNLDWFERFLPFDGPMTFEQEKSFLENILTEEKEISYGIWKKETNELIGSINVFDYMEHNQQSSAELGYMLFKKFAGNGYGPEAMEMLKNELLSRGVNTITAKIDEDNIRSRRAAEKAGLNWDGKEVETSKHDPSRKMLIYRSKRNSR